MGISEIGDRFPGRLPCMQRAEAITKTVDGLMLLRFYMDLGHNYFIYGCPLSYLFLESPIRRIHTSILSGIPRMALPIS